MDKRFIQSPKFQYVDMVCAAIAGLLWSFYGQVGWWPLLIALTPWLIRLFLGESPVQRTPFDLAMIIFLIMAGVGVWAAYNRESAELKFWVILGAILLYYAIARQPLGNIWTLLGGLAVFGAVITLVFLFLHDWQVYPADIRFIDHIGRTWMSVRPNFQWALINPNKVAGLLAILSPYVIVFGRRTWKARRERIAPLVIAIVTGGLIGLGLLMTSSRAAWIAIIAGYGTWFLWGISRYLSDHVRMSARAIFSLIFLVIFMAAVGLMLRLPSGILELVDRLPGYPSTASRLELASNTLYLIGDFPYSGGGLDSFAGLYSQYVMVIPHVLFDYSHNFYLDVALEQGLVGLLSMLTIFLGTGILMLVRTTVVNSELDWLRWAVLVSLVILILHGTLDDPLYANRGSILLFLAPGIGVAVRNASKKPRDLADDRGGRRLVAKTRPFLIVLVLAVGVISFLPQPLAAWIANMGAVSMARIELAQFPTGEWLESEKRNDRAAELTASKQKFQQAAALNSQDASALHRLGLISMLRMDYPAAVKYLERAVDKRPHQRGIRKNLGYSYIWLSDYDRAQVYLEGFPEVIHELEVYSWWWKRQGQDDLASKARTMRMHLNE